VRCVIRFVCSFAKLTLLRSIMKQRRVLDHNNLVAEATTQVQKWFVPKVPVIKKVRAPVNAARSLNLRVVVGD
jgi:hypothetical protein